MVDISGEVSGLPQVQAAGHSVRTGAAREAACARSAGPALDRHVIYCPVFWPQIDLTKFDQGLLVLQCCKSLRRSIHTAPCQAANAMRANACMGARARSVYL